MKHILSAKQFSKEYIERLFNKARHIEQHLETYRHGLSGRVMGTLFYEPSTRTRFSFEVAMERLSGRVVSCESAKINSSNAKGESLEDTFKTVSQFVDVIVVRHSESFSQAAECSDVPVINAGDGSNEHPTQALLDLYTILKYHPKLDGKTIVFAGDTIASRTVNSLRHLLEPYKVKVLMARPWITPEDIERGIILDNCIPFADVDVLYMTRHQKERYNYPTSESDFILTNEWADKMKKDAIILHPLPRNQEIHPSVDTNHRAKYFDQVKNGMYVRMAMLWSMLRDYDLD